MAESDIVLSSVHIGSNAKADIGTSTVLSKFYYTVPPHLPPERIPTDLHTTSHVDEDGDLDLPRFYKQELIVLEHTMATPIDRVGTQLWSASLLMADFIIHNKEIFSDAVILELGSGCGFVGIVAAKYARHVFCTDMRSGTILEQCHRNIIQNGVKETVSVHELNWTDSTVLVGASDQEEFTWQSHDVHMLTNTSIILACDVIYDNDLTDAFFDTLINLSTKSIHRPPLIMIALEKRINFTLQDLSPSSPCYDYFLSCLNKRYNISTSNIEDNEDSIKKSLVIKFDIKRLPLSFPQSFHYERVKQLEIWELKIKEDILV